MGVPRYDESSTHFKGSPDWWHTDGHKHTSVCGEARPRVSNVKICGRYNPLNGKAWSNYNGAESNTQFDIMILEI